MSSIDKLARPSSVTAGDLVAIFSSTLGTDAGVTLQILATYLETLLSSSGSSQTIYAAPNATGFSVPQLAPVVQGGNVWLLLTPIADYAAGTITLPATPTDGQRVNVSSTHAVTALTVAGAGFAVNGAPTALTANGFFALRYDGVSQSWYRYA